ncbi:MAG TPA: arginase family protein [Longimicrobiales bacterium]|nr:arginase family protein [Longimicrobiales bacterium]
MRALRLLAATAALFGIAVPGTAQRVPPVRVALVAMPYSGARNVPELSGGPGYLLDGGLEARLRTQGVALAPTRTVALSAGDEGDYGEWHRMGLANGHLAEMVSADARQGVLTVGLLANCTSVLGMLGGLQHQDPSAAPARVALVFIDAHGDFNVPETTLSGMLGGMPVAVSAGLALERLRRESGLDPALPTERIVMGAVRDLDPLERELVEASHIQHLSTEDLRRPEAVRAQMERLSRVADVIYVHVDMDVLDPAEVPGHPLTVAGGPTSAELAGALQEMFRFEKVAALGIASTPFGERDPDGVSRRAAYNLIDGAVRGLRARMPGS